MKNLKCARMLSNIWSQRSRKLNNKTTILKIPLQLLLLFNESIFSSTENEPAVLLSWLWDIEVWQRSFTTTLSFGDGI